MIRMHSLDWVLDRLRYVARTVLREYYPPQSCIGSTRIVIDVLDYFRFEAVALPVKCKIFNKDFIDYMVRNGNEPPRDDRQLAEWCKDGKAHSVGLGYGFADSITEEQRKKRWDGHLVAIVPHYNRVIDASIDQAERPERGIILPGVLIMQADRQFRKGRRALPVILKDPLVALRYQAVPKNTFYTQSPHWRRERMESEVAGQICRMIEAMEELPDEASTFRIPLCG